MSRRLYVGLVRDSLQGQVFRTPAVPTPETHGKLYAGVIGPFRTRRGADWMADPVKGRLNPHCRCVADAERLAKKYQT
jgi:hypothetical protein